MKSVTLLFPGQGSQYVGMGNNIRSLSNAKDVFLRADEALGFSISNLMSEGPDDKLALTEYTQPAIVTHSVALFKELKVILDELGIKIDRVLGHSVGEYSALVAANALSFEDSVKAVNKRGQFMQSATPEGVGSMYAILRVPGETVKKACEQASNESEKVMCANFNDPTQVVISGHSEACERAVKWIEENFDGRYMAKKLNVSAPFHSSLMKPAEENLSTYLNEINFNSNEISYIANIDANEYQTSGEQIKENLVKQVCASVLWEQSISKLADETICIEVGPGKVLAGLNKRINKAIKTYTLDSEVSLEGVREFLK